MENIKIPFLFTPNSCVIILSISNELLEYSNYKMEIIKIIDKIKELNNSKLEEYSYYSSNILIVELFNLNEL